MHIHYHRHAGCHSFKDLSTHGRIAGALHHTPHSSVKQESIFTFPSHRGTVLKDVGVKYVLKYNFSERKRKIHSS